MTMEQQQREEEKKPQTSENDKDEKVVQFLDSLNDYLTLMDSLSSALRQGWLELASARHSMGSWRINSATLDHKFHSASTTLQLSSPDDSNSNTNQPHFTLRKWESCDDEDFQSKEVKLDEDEVQKNSDDVQVQKERSKSLLVFGALVSPKLRDAQLSFETALETLVDIANRRSVMLSAYDHVREEILGTKQ
ncbi:hypothetical protein RJ641_003936 [Dillenia turbinata]|uniref:Vacuolar ATPase assembly protein VMA22 n=1 Tax=Dillenia turbinata TaxID=194707 RepID=A0AAN8VI55_9MAGN